MEQEQLDDLPGAVVEVTALAPQTGVAPHLELLCYQQPNVIDEVAAADDPRSTRLILEGADDVRTYRANQPNRSASGIDQTHIRDIDGHLLLKSGGF